MADGLPFRDALFSFLPNEELRAALFLTYAFDGRWFEEAIVPGLCERPVHTMLVVRDRNALSSEAPSVRYRKANAGLSRVFHPKLTLLVGEHRVRAIIGSANLTRGSFERQRELARVYDLSVDAAGERVLFEELIRYLGTGVARELRGGAFQDLELIVRALNEVVAKCPSPPSPSSHRLLHNYGDQPIWTQVLDLVPHTELSGALVMSPFYEADRAKPEDPADDVDDRGTSIFETQIYGKFSFAPKVETPLRVYFRTNAGKTELPIAKLKDLPGVAFFAQSDLDTRLHAKLVVLEGASRGEQKPYCLALHGSPNFTSAGLLRTVSTYGNAELAVLTTLPPKRKGIGGVEATLGLQSFVRVEDISRLETEPPGDSPRPLEQGLADVTLHVAARTLEIHLLKIAEENTYIRIFLDREGAWLPVAEGDVSGVDTITLPSSGILETDERTKLLELRGSVVRVVLIDGKGMETTSEGPLNVDSPQEFCGLTLVGASFATLDERIARAGIGLPPSYGEQQAWIEGRKSDEPGAVQSMSTHHADLDRFYANIHHGLRGILARFRASPHSEFTLRSRVHELSKWCSEVTDPAIETLTLECRLYLVDRLIRTLCAVLEGSFPSSSVPRAVILEELGLSSRMGSVDTWLRGVVDPALEGYVGAAKARLDRLGTLARAEGRA